MKAIGSVLGFIVWCIIGLVILASKAWIEVRSMAEEYLFYYQGDQTPVASGSGGSGRPEPFAPRKSRRWIAAIVVASVIAFLVIGGMIWGYCVCESRLNSFIGK